MNTDYLFFFPWLAVVVWLCVCAFRSDLTYYRKKWRRVDGG